MESNILEIIGANTQKGERANSIAPDFLNDNPLEWKQSEICISSFDPEDEELYCYIDEIWWEASPIEPVILDESPGGGGSPERWIYSTTTIPCLGNPVLNPRIAKQLGPSGINGGLFSDQYRTYRNDGSNKPHAGMDIETYEGQPIRSMHGGTVTSVGTSSTLGDYVHVTTIINGNSVTISYNHLEKQGRPAQGSEVEAGTIIGTSGTSGNLKGAIAEGSARQHIHIEAWIGDYKYIRNDQDPSVKNDLSKKAPHHIDPRGVMNTKYDANLNPINPC